MFGIFKRSLASGGAATDLNILTQEYQENSEKLKVHSESLSSASSEQAAAIQETIASLTEMRSMLVQTNENVRNSLEATEKATTLSEFGEQTVRKLIDAVETMNETNNQVEQLKEAFRTIHKKTRMINDIVFKTQLLSFNASIEAARAGQFGKGFSVVAEEVGRLAQTSGKASKEIEKLLAESEERVIRIVDQILSRSGEGRSVSREVNRSFEQIATAISEISRSMAQVGEASREQLAGIEQTTRAIEQIDLATQANRKSSEEILRIANRTSFLNDSLEALSEGSPAHGPKSAATVVPTPEEKREALALVDSLSQHQAKLTSLDDDPRLKMDADDDSFRKQE